MDIDLDQRTAALGVGDLAAFAFGPRGDGDGGASGLWRAQLGSQWHAELRRRATAEFGETARFELPIRGRVAHRGWCITLNGRIDQLITGPAGPRLREVKSVLHPLPADETALRADHPAYFIQLAAYAALGRLDEAPRDGTVRRGAVERGLDGAHRRVSRGLADELLGRR